MLYWGLYYPFYTEIFLGQVISRWLFQTCFIFTRSLQFHDPIWRFAYVLNGLVQPSTRYSILKAGDHWQKSNIFNTSKFFIVDWCRLNKAACWTPIYSPIWCVLNTKNCDFSHSEYSKNHPQVTHYSNTNSSLLVDQWPARFANPPGERNQRHRFHLPVVQVFILWHGARWNGHLDKKTKSLKERPRGLLGENDQQIYQWCIMCIDMAICKYIFI